VIIHAKKLLAISAPVILARMPHSAGGVGRRRRRTWAGALGVVVVEEAADRLAGGVEAAEQGWFRMVQAARRSKSMWISS
jgi:hypothetical protein